MGKSDAAVGIWLSDKERFADLFNARMFDGEEIIKPKELERLPGESKVQFPDKNDSTKTVKRYRDIIMRWKQEITLAILALENQDKINYFMPVRNMTYDSITYTEQAEILWKQHQEEVKKMTKEQCAVYEKEISFEEKMSRFIKTDKIYPVITLVFYYGEAPWDASRDLYGLFPEHLLLENRDILERYVPNYWINLIDAYRIKNMPFRKTDLQMIFQMLQYKKEKTLMKQYITNHQDFFGNIDSETYQAIHALLHSQAKISFSKLKKDKKEGISMCEAFEEYYRDGEEHGIKIASERMSKLITKLFDAGRSYDVEKGAKDPAYLQRLYQEFNL